MATQLDFCWGMSQPVNLYHYDKTCEQAIELVFALGLSFYSVAVGFAVLCCQHWILVNFNTLTAAFIEV